MNVMLGNAELDGEMDCIAEKILLCGLKWSKRRAKLVCESVGVRCFQAEVSGWNVV